MHKVACVVCGKYKSFTDDRYQANISKFGSSSELQKKYPCRDCRGLVDVDPQVHKIYERILPSLKEEIEKEVTTASNKNPKRTQ
ncbi:MAG TPA: hypothetical protein VNX68_04475 [Nitrosopumilaceae archaeon]|jgi:hypothetical protein|nr:hypothetical protein [Nitrosopumilaceae archaeon]